MGYMVHPFWGLSGRVLTTLLATLLATLVYTAWETMIVLGYALVLPWGVGRQIGGAQQGYLAMDTELRIHGL